MSTGSNDQTKCPYCGMFHTAICHTVKAIEYHPDGSMKRVEFKSAADYPQQVISAPSVFSVGGTPTKSAENTCQSSSAFPPLCDSGGELWDADEAS